MSVSQKRLYEIASWLELSIAERQPLHTDDLEMLLELDPTEYNLVFRHLERAKQLMTWAKQINRNPDKYSKEFIEAMEYKVTIRQICGTPDAYAECFFQIYKYKVTSGKQPDIFEIYCILRLLDISNQYIEFTD